MTTEAKRMRANSLLETRLAASMVMAEAAELAAQGASFKVENVERKPA